ncbi:hypothetical protein HDE_01711 [Halotydeus destructor]|nr:hypothetical protein HDE_01711 [Halotydeus destructor]
MMSEKAVSELANDLSLPSEPEEIELDNVQLRKKANIVNDDDDDDNQRTSLSDDDDIKAKPILVSNRPGARSSVHLNKTVRFMISSEDIVKRPQGEDESMDTFAAKFAANLKRSANKALDSKMPKDVPAKRSKSVCTFKHISNLVLFVVLASLVVVQFYQLNDKKASASSGMVTVSEMVTFKDLVPGITLCTSNIVDLSRLEQFLPLIRKKLEDADLDLNDTMARPRMLEPLVSKYIESAPVKEIFKLAPTSSKFVGQIYCDNVKWTKTEEVSDYVESCSNLYRVRTINSQGTCFTLFTAQAILAAHNNDSKDEETYSEKDTIYFMLGIPKREKLFEPKQYVELNLNFDSVNFYNPEVTIGGKMIIHSNKDIPSILERGHSIRPGRCYQAYVSKTLLKRSSNCVDYLKVYGDKLRASQHSINLHLATSHEMCINLCVSRAILDKCRCWPHTVPFSRDNQTTRYSVYWCGPVLTTVCGQLEARRACTKKCPLDCQHERIDYHISEEDCPSDAILSHLEYQMDKATNMEDKKKIEEQLIQLRNDQINKAVIRVSYVNLEKVIFYENNLNQTAIDNRYRNYFAIVSLIGLVILALATFYRIALLLKQLNTF